MPGIRERMEAETAESLEREGLKAGKVEPWEDGWRTRERPDTFEWWYFDAEVDYGGKAVAVFNTRPQMHPRSPLNPSVLLIMKSPEGKKVRLIPKFMADEFSSEPNGCDVSIGKNHVRGDLDRYELHVEVESYSADLVFARKAPSWRPGSGISYSGRDKGNYFGWVVPVPYGTVEGTVVFEGEERRVKGTCYHDHNWGNISPGHTIDHWYWGRAHPGEFTVIFVEMVTRHVIGLGSLKLHTFLLVRGRDTHGRRAPSLTYDERFQGRARRQVVSREARLAVERRRGERDAVVAKPGVDRVDRHAGGDPLVGEAYNPAVLEPALLQLQRRPGADSGHERDQGDRAGHGAVRTDGAEVASTASCWCPTRCSSGRAVAATGSWLIVHSTDPNPGPS